MTCGRWRCLACQGVAGRAAETGACAVGGSGRGRNGYEPKVGSWVHLAGGHLLLQIGREILEQDDTVKT